MNNQPNPEKLQRYADLIVAHGLNVQPGQMVNIGAEVCHRELAHLVADSAYRRGASFVNIDLVEPRLLCSRITHSREEYLSHVPNWVGGKYAEFVDVRAANVAIVGMEDPLLYTKLDPKAVNIARMALYKARKRYYDEGIGKSGVHWTVAAGATEGWGKRIFPNAPDPLSMLWDQIFSICRVDTPDYLERWRLHNHNLHERARYLTSLAIKQLHFRGPGTDLTVGLSKKAVFKSGGEVGPYGVEFEPNLPTEECFTTPDWRVTSGTVRATRPFLINGVLIEGLTLRFDQGEIVEFSASSGEQTFREYIGSDPGAKRLGEVALVGIDSPIFTSGLVFEEILFDENAACHIAVGSAYKFCLNGGATASALELAELGCNESSVHTDMMISSEEVSVEAETWNGQRVLLLENGAWKPIK